jgi:hypothetical protein
MPKRLAELTIPQTNEIRPDPHNTALQSPATPVTAEDLMLLQNVIMQQDIHALNDETRKQRFQKQLQKFGKAAQASFAKGALQQNQIRLMMAVNNEAKVRRSTKSVVLGTARILGYDDLVEARAKREEQDAAKEKSKGKRGRKPKKAAAEAVDNSADDPADGPEDSTTSTADGTADRPQRGRKRKNAVPEGAEVDGGPKSKKVQKSKTSGSAQALSTQTEQEENSPGLSKVPVARMW